MKIATVLNKVLDAIPAVSASELAKRAEVNKGQLSAFLKKNGPLAEDKQAMLINCLLEMKTVIQLRPEQETKLHPLIKQLNDFVPYRVKFCEDEADPYQYILYGWDRYIEREVEQDILAYIARRPFVMGITSGPKTGKTSIAHRVKMEVGKTGTVVYLDCKLYEPKSGASLVEWIFQTAAQQLVKDFDHPPTDWVTVVTWLKQDLLTSNLTCTFIFDHLEALGNLGDLGNLALDFSSGWHYVLNQTRDEPALKALGLVLAYDPASKALHDAMYHSSRLEQRTRVFVPDNFSRGLVTRLHKSLLGGAADESVSGQLMEDAWKLFQGHPFLTHVYAHAYSNNKLADAAKSAIAEAETAFEKGIKPALLNSAYTLELQKHFCQPLSLNSTLANEMQPHRGLSVLLQDTGLFFETGFGGNAKLQWTAWVHERLKAVFLGAPSDDQAAQ